MKQTNHPADDKEREPKSDQLTPEQAPEGEGRNRRSFLTHAAMGVAGTAGLMALGAQAGQAAESSNTTIKSKILDRIKLQMSPNIEPVDDGGGGDGYIKNTHSLYVKA